ncbi:hypothetical protein LSTR_LSTR016114 [Laodelphax striatellus]|uniref:Uncharacterized protein n=1 Tax=Laodelphax striatellus TaxID=195883 RepID=A0A482XBF5_LAOST|nr:hypothetical protein LSTR_LSTR016114 [Laodelphax striatellus]
MKRLERRVCDIKLRMGKNRYLQGLQIDGHSDEHTGDARNAGSAVRALTQPLLGGRQQGAPQRAQVLQGHRPPTHRGRARQTRQC